MRISISNNSGFCFGVKNTINVAEQLLKKHGSLFCIGDIVHNKMEIIRLKEMGLIAISRNDLNYIHNTRVLIRAHGEPPLTYQIAAKNNIEIIDATCPVVLKLQSRIKKSFEEAYANDNQIIIYGKEGHPEVEGLLGQTANKAVVIGNGMENIEKIDFSKPIVLYSQTTQDKSGYYRLIEEIKKRLSACYCGKDHKKPAFTANNTICSQVTNRGPHLQVFAEENDVIIFVSGKNSSNGQYLAGLCRQVNRDTHWVENESEIKKEWLKDAESIGICGATSTPLWLMESVADRIRELSAGN